MKKNKFWKIAGAIFTMCLMTTCAIGTTFAKYTTSSSASDTARVAKWGVEVSASGTMFGKNYGANTATENQNSIVAGVSGSVDTATGDGSKIVAPGTKNDTGIQISIKGQPEVAYEIKAEKTQDASDIFLKKGNYGVMIATYGINAATDFSVEKLYTKDNNGTYVKATTYSSTATYYRLTDEATVATEFYYPIAWTASVSVDGTTYTQDDPAYATLGEAFNALINGINNYDGEGTVGCAQFNANTKIDLVYNLTWAWAFEKQNDGADTILGNLMAGDVTVVKLVEGTTNYTAIENTDYNLTVGSGFKVTATQLD